MGSQYHSFTVSAMARMATIATGWAPRWRLVPSNKKAPTEVGASCLVRLLVKRVIASPRLRDAATLPD